MEHATLVFLLKDNMVCLAMKKRVFGKGKWNGSGGKIGDMLAFRNETPIEAAQREVLEELGVAVKKLIPAGEVRFVFPHKSEWDTHVYLFITKQWQGTPTETEEMRPQWFSFDAIPYDTMWDDDKYWLPKVLSGKKVFARFVFDSKEKVIYTESSY